MGTLRLKFWGTRGIISSPRIDTTIYGGSTPCAQILYKDNLILIDSGWGITNLGEELITRILTNRENLKIHLLYTHFHWDHIQGLPFFSPLYFESTKLNIYSPQRTNFTKKALDVAFDPNFSPFNGIDSMQARISFHQLNGGGLEIDGLKIEYQVVDHGDEFIKVAGYNTHAYKLTTPDDESICFITDHEAKDTKVNRELIEFAKGCDLLVHDAQHTQDEYKDLVGHGHSDIHSALENAKKINAGNTILTHHDPSRVDRELQRLTRALKSEDCFKNMKFEFARENTVYKVHGVSKPITTKVAG